VFYQNYWDAGPGHLVQILDALDVDLVVCDVWNGDRQDIAQFHMAFFGGAPLDPNAQDDATLWLIKQIQVGFRDEIPMFGICRGLQLMALAAGGGVVTSSRKEEGMVTANGSPHVVCLTPEGELDMLFRGLEDDWFPVFQMHKLMCDLSNVPDAVLLGWGMGCYVQVVKYKTMYGIQSHIEFDYDMMLHFTSVPDFQKLGSDLMEKFMDFYPEYFAFAERIIANFVDFAKQIWSGRELPSSSC
jgi:GMP synthase-like glutamine amidotransferase